MEEQLRLERQVNKELALRLQSARQEAKDARRQLSQASRTPATGPIGAEHGELLQTGLAMQTCGINFDEVTPLLLAALSIGSPECDRNGNSTGLTSLLSAAPTGPGIRTALQHGRTAAQGLVDAFAVVGPDPAAVSSCLQQHWPSLHKDSRTTSTSGIPVGGTMLSMLAPRILAYLPFDGSTIDGAVAAGLADFACPTGSVLKTLDPVAEVSRALRTAGHATDGQTATGSGMSHVGAPAAEGPAPKHGFPPSLGRAVYEALLDRHGLRRGPRTHVFVLSGGLAGESGPALDEADVQAASAASKALVPHAPLVAGTTRYALCITATDVLTPGILRALAPGGSSGDDRAAGWDGGAGDLVVTVPRVFVLISRYPWFFPHLDILKTCVRVWYSSIMDRLGVMYRAGACRWLDDAVAAHPAAGQSKGSSGRHDGDKDGSGHDMSSPSDRARPSLSSHARQPSYRASSAEPSPGRAGGSTGYGAHASHGLSGGRQSKRQGDMGSPALSLRSPGPVALSMEGRQRGTFSPVPQPHPATSTMYGPGDMTDDAIHGVRHMREASGFSVDTASRLALGSEARSNGRATVPFDPNDPRHRGHISLATVQHEHQPVSGQGIDGQSRANAAANTIPAPSFMSPSSWTNLSSGLSLAALNLDVAHSPQKQAQANASGLGQTWGTGVGPVVKHGSPLARPSSEVASDPFKDLRESMRAGFAKLTMGLERMRAGAQAGGRQGDVASASWASFNGRGDDDVHATRPGLGGSPSRPNTLSPSQGHGLPRAVTVSGRLPTTGSGTVVMDEHYFEAPADASQDGPQAGHGDGTSSFDLTTTAAGAQVSPTSPVGGFCESFGQACAALLEGALASIAMACTSGTRASDDGMAQPEPITSLVRAYAASAVPLPGTRLQVGLGQAGREAADLLKGLYGGPQKGEAGQGKAGVSGRAVGPTHAVYIRPAEPAVLDLAPHDKDNDHDGHGCRLQCLLPRQVPSWSWQLGCDLDSPSFRHCASEWACPVLFSLLPLDSVLLILGALLSEYKVLVVGGHMSQEAVSACVLALHALLAPLAWAGPFLPTLPRTLLDVVSAPVPTLLGVQQLPTDWAHEDSCVVVLLDRETVRIPAGRPPLNAAGQEDHAAWYRDVPGFLQLQLPGNSALYHRLSGHAGAMRAVVTPNDGGGGAGPRPCYRPSAAQVTSCRELLSGIQGHVQGLLDRLFAHEAAVVQGLQGACMCDVAASEGVPGAPPPVTIKACRSSTLAMRSVPPMPTRLAAVLATAPEVEAPFWHRFSSSQMVSVYAHALRHRTAWVVARAMVRVCWPETASTGHDGPAASASGSAVQAAATPPTAIAHVTEVTPGPGRVPFASPVPRPPGVPPPGLVPAHQVFQPQAQHQPNSGKAAFRQQEHIRIQPAQAGSSSVATHS